MERNGKAGGVTEQRFVVEITRPVPPDKVAIVAERIAARLRLDLERIHTLIDGRVGPVTRPVLSEKADSIAEVFAEAGVRVIVVGAPSSATASPTRVGGTAREVTSAETAAPETSAPELAAREAQPSAEETASEPIYYDQADYDVGAARTEPEASEVADFDPTGPDPTGPGPAAPESIASERTGTADTWDTSTAWGYVAGDVDQWQAAQDELGPLRVAESSELDESSYGPAQSSDDVDQSSQLPEASAPADHQGEDEADRLGPASSRTMPEQLFTTSTRWVPSPHDAYGFDPNEEPYVPAEEGQGEAADDGQRDYFQPGGYEVPEWRGGYPRRAPALRTYLLWSLAASLVVLVLLQVVFAARGFAGGDQLDYGVGLRAFQQGDFVSAKRTWEALASEGEPRAQYQLGFMAQHGLGQPWSNARAANYYRRAAEAGLPVAQLALGDLYLRGMGVEQDAPIGAQLYRRAAESGYAEAQYEYAQLLMHGEGVAQRFGEALSWFEAAAAGGVVRAADLIAFVKAASPPSPH